MLLSFRGVDPCILHLEFVHSGELGGCATSVPFGKKELTREPMRLRGMCGMLVTARATCRNAQPLDVQKLSRRKSIGRQENLCRFSGFCVGGLSGWADNGETIDLVPQEAVRKVVPALHGLVYLDEKGRQNFRNRPIRERHFDFSDSLQRNPAGGSGAAHGGGSGDRSGTREWCWSGTRR